MRRADEIRRFAHRLERDGQLKDGIAVIGPEHVQTPLARSQRHGSRLLMVPTKKPRSDRSGGA